jgi:hypothetical protein
MRPLGLFDGEMGKRRLGKRGGRWRVGKRGGRRPMAGWWPAARGQARWPAAGWWPTAGVQMWVLALFIFLFFKYLVI